MPRSRHYDDDSPPRRGGGTRVAEYEEDIEIRTRREGGRDRRTEFLDADYRREEPGPLVVREEEVVEERRTGGRPRSYSRERGGAARDRSRRRPDSESFEEETVVSRSRNGDRPRRRDKDRDVFEEEVRVRGPRGGEIDFYERDEDSRSRHGGRRGFEEEEEIRIKAGGPSRRRRHSHAPVEREEISEEVIYSPKKRQPSQIVNEEWSYRPKPREPSPPFVARETEEWVYRPRERDQAYEEITIRDRERDKEPERRPRPRDGWEEDITIRERDRDGPRGGDDYHDREIRIRERSRDPPREPAPTPPRAYYDEEIRISGRERDAPRQRSGYDEEIRIRERESDRPRQRSAYDEDIRIRERDGGGRGGGDDYREEDISIRRRERDRPQAPLPPRREARESELVIRRSSPSPAPTERTHRPRGKDRVEDRELIIRRDEYDDTRSRRGGEHEEIIIRNHESSPEPSPPPPPPDLYAPPIHREIVTHHRDVYHTPERTRPPPSPKQQEVDEIEIRHKGERNGKSYEEDIVIDRRRSSPGGRRASSVGARTSRREPVDEEIDIYRRSNERKDWSIVDVPADSERVRVNANGNSQEITWSRSNGVRRSGNSGPSQELELRKFVGQRTKEDKMWTEITKDLVVKDALDGTGYEYEETEYFFYVMQYLGYEDVLRLVRISDDIREKRKDRIRQMEWEAKNARPPPRAIAERGWDEERERIVEREYFGGPPPPAPRAPPSRKPNTEVRERDTFIRIK